MDEIITKTLMGMKGLIEATASCLQGMNNYFWIAVAVLLILSLTMNLKRKMYKVRYLLRNCIRALFFTKSFGYASSIKHNMLIDSMIVMCWVITISMIIKLLFSIIRNIISISRKKKQRNYQNKKKYYQSDNFRVRKDNQNNFNNSDNSHSFNKKINAEKEGELDVQF